MTTPAAPPSAVKKSKHDSAAKHQQTAQHDAARGPDLVQLRKLWNEARVKAVDPKERQKVIDKIMKQAKGHIEDLVLKHDVSRIVQTLLKHGSLEQRQAVFAELKPHITDLLKSQYASFLVQKLAKYCGDDARDFIFHKLAGRISRLLRHRSAVPILDYAMTHASHDIRASFLAECYGPQYQLAVTDTQTTLPEAVQKHPELAAHVTQHVLPIVEFALSKGMAAVQLVLRLSWDYFRVANTAQRVDFAALWLEHALDVAHTHDGSRIAMYCLAFSPPAGRKKLLKKCAETQAVLPMAQDEFGNRVLMKALGVVDDTRLLAKTVLTPLMGALDTLVLDKWGHAVLLYVLEPGSRRHFHPDTLRVLHDITCTEPGHPCTSKKDPLVRRRELLEVLAPPLLAALARNADACLRSTYGAPVLETALRTAPGPTAEVLRAVAALCGDATEDGVVAHNVAHRALGRLLVLPPTDESDPVLAALVLDAVRPNVAKLVRLWGGQFTLLRLVEHPATGAAARELVLPHRAALAAATGPGAVLLLNALAGKSRPAAAAAAATGKRAAAEAAADDAGQQVSAPAAAAEAPVRRASKRTAVAGPVDGTAAAAAGTTAPATRARGKRAAEASGTSAASAAELDEARPAASTAKRVAAPSASGEAEPVTPRRPATRASTAAEAGRKAAK